MKEIKILRMNLEKAYDRVNREVVNGGDLRKVVNSFDRKKELY